MSNSKDNWRLILGIVKDRSSKFKNSLLARRNASVHQAVLRATSHQPSLPPLDDHIAGVFYYGQRSQVAAKACIEALLSRLHRTRSAPVALKCLFVLHRISLQGSSVLSDQFGDYGCNFGIASFNGGSDVETAEMSSWVRWYGAILERNSAAWKILGYPLSTNSTTVQIAEKFRILNPVLYPEMAGKSRSFRVAFYKTEMKFAEMKTSDLLPEIEALVELVEQVGDSPSSLYQQKKDLVYDVVRQVGQTYRLVQYEIAMRVKELENRISNELDLEELTWSLGLLKRLENCRDGLMVLFVNRHRNDAFWEQIGRTKMQLLMEKERQENQKVMVIRNESAWEVAGREQFFQLMSTGVWNKDMNQVCLSVSAVG